MTIEERSSPTSGTAPGTKVTPELVRKIADNVYALWLKELRIENERRGTQIIRRLYRGKS